MIWGFSTLGCPELSLPEAAALADRFGFPHLELRTVSGSLNLPEVLRRPVNRTVLRQLADAGRVRILGTSFGLAGSQTGDREELAAFAALADEFNIPYLRVFGGFPFESGLGENRLRLAAANLDWWRRQCCRCQLALETHDGFSSAARVRQLFDALGEELPVIWDVHHTFSVGGETPAASFALIGRTTVDVHVKDAVHLPDGGQKAVLPGDGELPVPATLALLEAEKYAGDVTLEYEKQWQPYLPPLPEALTAVNRCWKK